MAEERENWYRWEQLQRSKLRFFFKYSNYYVTIIIKYMYNNSAKSSLKNNKLNCL